MRTKPGPCESTLVSSDPRARRRQALIIGGSGGIGRAITLQLCSEGIDVVATGAHKYKLKEVAGRAAELPGRFEAIEIRAAGADELLSAVARTSPIDILICAFGPVLYAPVSQTDLEGWRRVVDFNLVLPGALIHRFLPAMVERDYGRVLFFGVEGSQGVKAYREIGAYSAAKTGLSVLVRSLALELAGSNVAVSALCPGYVDTEYLTEADRRRFSRRTDGAQLQKPDEIAKAACYLVNAVDRRFNGAIIPLSGLRIDKNGDVEPLFDNRGPASYYVEH